MDKQTGGSLFTWWLVEAVGRVDLQLETSDHCRSSHTGPELIERTTDTGDILAIDETVHACVLTDNYLPLYVYFVCAAFQHWLIVNDAVL